MVSQLYHFITTKWVIIQFSVIFSFSILTIKYFAKPGRKIFGSFSYFISIFLTLFVCWIPHFIKFELNGDESQWLANANNFYHNPLDWIKYYMGIDGRVLTIIPLSIMCIFSYPMKWISVRVFCVILWALFIFVNNSTIQQFFSKKIANISSIVIIFYIGTTRQAHIISYNSELPSIILISFISYFLIKLLSSSSNRLETHQVVILGVAIPALCFIKDQSIFIGFTLEILCLYIFFTQKKYRHIIYLLISNFIISCVFIYPYFIFNSSEVLSDGIIFRNNYRHFGLYGIKLNLEQKIYGFITSLYKSELGKLFNLALSSLLACLIFMQFKKIKFDYPKIKILIFIVILLFVSLFTIYHPVDKFIHYYIYIIPPCILLISYGISLLYSEINKSIKFLFLTATFFIYFIGHKYKIDKRIWTYSYDKNMTFTFNNKLSKKITDLKRPEDRILIWGWNNSYYIETGLLPASRYLILSVLNPNFGNREFRIKLYLEDLQNIKPKFVLELVGNDQFYTKDKNIYSISAFAQIQEYINSNYNLAETIGNEKLYLRKK